MGKIYELTMRAKQIEAPKKELLFTEFIPARWERDLEAEAEAQRPKQAPKTKFVYFTL